MRHLLLCLSIIVLSASCASRHQVPMRQDDFGLNFIVVSVNGRTGNFLIDSGASHTVLDHRFAQQTLRDLTTSDLRLAWLGSRNAQTQSGIIDQFQIGPYQRNGPIPAHVMNLDAINDTTSRRQTINLDGIIGGDFLREHQALIDYGKSLLIFSAATSPQAVGY